MIAMAALEAFPSKQDTTRAMGMCTGSRSFCTGEAFAPQAVRLLPAPYL